jgi:hypothetical protein
MSRQASDLESARPQPLMGAPSRAGVSLPAAPSPGEYVRILVIAALLGAPVTVAAALFMSLPRADHAGMDHHPRSRRVDGPTLVVCWPFPPPRGYWSPRLCG